MNVSTPPFAPTQGTRRVLIIDDEPLARQVLRTLLAAHPMYAAVGEAGTFAQAQARLGAADYDLVLLDVQLRGGNGFDLVPFIRAEARTIFVTAFDSYALRAFEVNALDYLLKPVAAERFAAALKRVGQAGGAHLPAAPAEEPTALQPLTSEDTVLIHTDAGDHFIPVAEIAAVFSHANYSDVQLRSGRRHFTRRTMRTWEDLLPRDCFRRVHRHALVNLACIERQHLAGGKIFEIGVTGVREPVAVSRSCAVEMAGILATRSR